MPKKVDHDVRRRELAEALWRITRRDGLEAASLRQVAAEAGVSVGLVQHYFATKDQMLHFALERIGEDLAGRLARRVGELPEPRDPREVVRIVMLERLPLTEERRVHAQAGVAWLGRAALRPELTDYMVEGTSRLRDYLADQLRRGQQHGQVATGVNPRRAAEALLALSDGLAAQILSGQHGPDSARQVLECTLDHLFAQASKGSIGDSV